MTDVPPCPDCGLPHVTRHGTPDDFHAAATRIAQLAQTAEGDTADIVETAREEWGYLSGADQQRGREPVATTDSDARTRASLGYVVLRRGVTDWMQVEPSAGHGRGTAR